MDVVPNNLPLQLSSFIGRERDIAEVQGLLAKARLVTLTGAGGCGKTRLAIQVASDLSARSDRQGLFTSGIWLISLAALADKTLVPQAIVEGLGIHEHPAQSLSTTLTNFLRDKELLLLLDNCEHVIEGCAEMSETLLQTCPQVRILATSRQALNVAGEVNWLVRSLSTPDSEHLITPEALTQFEAVRLFVERATAVRSSFQLTSQNAKAVAQICRGLDGIPLAIELAAARIKALPVEQVAERLDDVFSLLTGGSRTALPRHQTLRATMDWSYALLSQTERLLFRRLSVFAGGSTLEAVEAVCGEDIQPGQVLDLLTNVVDKSLVLLDDQSGTARYRLLEPLRQYGRQKQQESGEETRIQDQHLDFFVQFAEAADAQSEVSDPLIQYQRLEAEHDNLRSALEWSLHSGRSATGLRLAGAMGQFWIFRGYLVEGKGWFERTLAAAPDAAPAVRAKALNCMAGIAWRQLDLATASSKYRESLALYQASDNQRGIARTLYYLGVLAVNQGDHPSGRTLLLQGLGMMRSLGDKFGVSLALNALGFLAQLEQAYEIARPYFEERLRLSRELGDRRGIAITLSNLSGMLLDQDDHAALEMMLEGLQLTQEVGDRLFVSTWLFTFARFCHTQSQPERAARLLGAQEALGDALGARLQPTKQAEYEPLRRAVRAQLDEAEFRVLWAEGRALTLEQAIAEAEKVMVALPVAASQPAALYPADLTEREVEVLRLLARGLSNAEIGEQLVVSPRTVGAHLRSIYGKLDVTTRTAAARVAAELKIL